MASKGAPDSAGAKQHPVTFNPNPPAASVQQALASAKAQAAHGKTRKKSPNKLHAWEGPAVSSEPVRKPRSGSQTRAGRGDGVASKKTTGSRPPRSHLSLSVWLLADWDN
jgi:hypothetical protein